MEAPRHWRLRKDRYSLRGEKIELEDGTIRVRLNGSSTWTELRTNGHHEGENPLEGTIIYQAQPPEKEDLAIPFSIHSAVDIPASSS